MYKDPSIHPPIHTCFHYTCTGFQVAETYANIHWARGVVHTGQVINHSHRANTHKSDKLIHTHTHNFGVFLVHLTGIYFDCGRRHPEENHLEHGEHVQTPHRKVSPSEIRTGSSPCDNHCATALPLYKDDQINYQTQDVNIFVLTLASVHLASQPRSPLLCVSSAKVRE